MLVPRTKTRKRFTETVGQPAKLYTGPIAISEPKFKDLQVLKRFCCPDNYEYFDNIPHEGSVADKFHSDETVISDSD